MTVRQGRLQGQPQRRLLVRVTLDEVEPEIWRLLEIGGSRTLAELHDALQITLGWTDSHLHAFVHADGRRWAPASEENELDELDEAATTLAEATGSGSLRYEYDFGDSWTHGLEVVGETEGDEAAVVLLDGARSAPPENCGGPSGYEHLLATLSGPSRSDREVAEEWLARARHPWSPARAFDAEELDVERVNRRLAERFARTWARAGWGHELAVLVELLPPGARTALGDRLEEAELERPVVIDPDDALACVQPFAWFLDRVGSSLSLTPAGRLPPAIVLEASRELGWDQRWIGTMNREDHVPPAFLLREQATKALLVRKLRGALLPTRAGAAARRDPLVLFGHLAAYALRLARVGPEREAGVLLLVELATGAEPDRESVAEAVAFGLHVRGYAGEDGWSPPSRMTTSGLFASTWALLGALGLVEDRFRDPVRGSRHLVREFARLALQEG